MAATTFQQGEDQKLSVQVIEAGAAVDISVCTNIKAILKVNNIEQKKYALVPETDHGTLIPDVTNTNQANIMVEREESKNFPVGAVTVILLCAFPDPEFSDGVRVQEYKFSVGRVAQGEGLNEMI
jgi:hypothetical protein